MATLTEKYWAGEKIKVKIYMEDNIVYEVTNNPEDDESNFIYNINCSNNEGNDSVNPMGIMTSSTCDMEIYDVEDLLSPSNENSPYYNKLVNGIKIEVYIKGTGENDVYELYGEYYTTSFSGSYSDGTHGMVNITSSDKLTTIGNKEVPKLKDYAGITLDKLLKKVFNGIGIEDSMYNIDDRLDTDFLYGVLPGTKVGEFLNNICALMFARIRLGRDGVIYFIPADKLGHNYNSITIGIDELSSLRNENSNNIDYNEISIKYRKDGTTNMSVIGSISNYNLVSGEWNVIDDITFSNYVLDIRDINFVYDSPNDNAIITNVKYEAYTDGMRLQVYVTGANIPDCNIEITGIVLAGKFTEVKRSIANASKEGGRKCTIKMSAPMTDAKANSLLDRLETHLIRTRRRVYVDSCILTPRLYVGDKVTISETNTFYDGDYKVVNQDINFGEEYSMSLELMKLIND